jgi:hypothetical protein
VGGARALVDTHLTLPSLRDGPLPLPPKGRRGISRSDRHDQAEGDPQRHRVDRQGQREMRHQPVLADFDAVGEAAFDHVPAEHPLRRPKRENPSEGPRKAARNAAATQEIKERQGIGEADQPAPQAVDVFPPIDRLELDEAHAGVHQAVLRDVLIPLELGGPGGGRLRRQNPGDRLPLGDRQTRQGQPRDAADHHHHEDHAAAQEQPRGDGP